MLKTLLLSAALIAGTTTFALADMSPDMGLQTGRSATVHHKKNRVLANGRCNGVSYGTGARGCGTKTGGLVGGNPSRN